TACHRRAGPVRSRIQQLRVGTVVLVVRDLRVVRKNDVADGNGWNRLRTQSGGMVSDHLRHSLVRNVHQKTDGFQRLKPKVPRDEAAAIRVDEVARDVFSQSERRMASQLPVAKARVVLGPLVCSDYPTAVQPIARQEPLGGQHAVGVRIVKTFGIPPFALVISLEPPYIAFTTISQCILFGIKYGLLAPHLIEAIHLIDGPIQTALESL